MPAEGRRPGPHAGRAHRFALTRRWGCLKFPRSRTRLLHVAERTVLRPYFGLFALGMWNMSPSSHRQKSSGRSTENQGWGLNSCLRRAETVHWRRLDDEVVLLDLDSGVYSTLNAVGSVIWDRCDGTISVKEIVDEIVLEFEVVEQQAHDDTLEFLDDLIERGYLLP